MSTVCVCHGAGTVHIGARRKWGGTTADCKVWGHRNARERAQCTRSRQGGCRLRRMRFCGLEDGQRRNPIPPGVSARERGGAPLRRRAPQRFKRAGGALPVLRCRLAPLGEKHGLSKIRGAGSHPAQQARGAASCMPNQLRGRGGTFFLSGCPAVAGRSLGRRAALHGWCQHGVSQLGGGSVAQSLHAAAAVDAPDGLAWGLKHERRRQHISRCGRKQWQQAARADWFVRCKRPPLVRFTHPAGWRPTAPSAGGKRAPVASRWCWQR